MGATYPLGGTRHHHGTPWFVAEPAAGPKPNPLAPIPATPSPTNGEVKDT